jgi:CcmD family protein
VSDAPYVIAGYLLTSVGIGGYVVWLLSRGRRLTRQVPEERRRWT